jgi:hypothetical protein
MRKVSLRETRQQEGTFVLLNTDVFSGSYLFHKWGIFNGMSAAILEHPETGECMLAPPGQIKFIKDEPKRKEEN